MMKTFQKQLRPLILLIFLVVSCKQKHTGDHDTMVARHHEPHSKSSKNSMTVANREMMNKLVNRPVTVSRDVGLQFMHWQH